MLSWIIVALICLATTTAHAQYWTVTGSLNNAREYHTAALLLNGNVLVAGGLEGIENPINSVEVYNATTGVWTLTGNLSDARASHTATLLPNGNVLVAGGTNGLLIGFNSAELYNATTCVWTVTGNLTYGRWFHTATLLPNGNVLVVGGAGDGFLNSAEVYNAKNGIWTVTGSLTYARYEHTATMLANGNVLVAAGCYGTNCDTYLSSAEVYDTSIGVWTVTDSLTYARAYHTDTLLPNGYVLVAGGDSTGKTAELYNPTTGVWTMTGNLTNARYENTATLLLNGNVLAAGGEYVNTAEVYDASTGVWTVTGSLTYARNQHTATLLANGNVLAAGGENNISPNYLNSAELYNGPNVAATPTPTPTPTSTSTTPAPTSSSAPTNALTTPTPTSSSTSSTEATPTPFSSAITASSSNAGAIAGGIIGGLVGLSLLLFLLWFLRSRFWNKKDMNSDYYKNPMIAMSSSQSQRSGSQISDVNRSIDASRSRSETGTSSFLSNRQSNDIYISFNSLQLGDVLGQGHFGQVYQANYTGAQVAIKKSKGIDEKLILEEATMMKNLPPHPNVLQYYGVSQENGEFMMVTELCDKGNLARYLRNPKNNLTSQQCRQFCRQIASGMWHISKYGIIHRDLRAENILLSGDTKLVAKVADFGLSRSLQSLNDQNDSGYYRMAEFKPIPVAWTAPEVINDSLKYVAASDVWSFGVLMWEIHSHGAKPFEGISVQVVVEMIRDPIRSAPLLARPNKCPDDIFNIMRSCWAFNPQDRPTFEQLYNQLS